MSRVPEDIDHIGQRVKKWIMEMSRTGSFRDRNAIKPGERIICMK